MGESDRRKRVESLFNEAASIDSSRREAFLDERCAGDLGLRGEVESMLARHEDMTADFLESPAGDANVLTSAHAGERVKIGPYKILETLGEGGFGVVYLAEQTSPVVRKVALKVIKPGMDSKAVLARFEAERQALAMMDHPCIAKVYNAGTTEQGRPYFAMEQVKGLPITEFCNQHQLGITARIDLFMRVCDAIQHAHQKGVIHRDIKPSNILVAYEDNNVSPKVIDFGVAKALNQKLTEKTIFTEQGQLIGTPEYMSPEQAEMSSLDIDTRSDIYSMGVLLYELLSGRLPFEPEQLRSAGFAEIQRIIREVDPPKPSTRLSSMMGRKDDSEIVSRIAASRRISAGDLPRRLRGDLDWIVMRCLEKDRARRYSTAGAVAEELKRYLSHEPVLAGPPSVGYRLQKFVRRNRAGVIAASLLLVVMTAGLVGTTYGLFEANAAREAEAEQRTLAETRAQEAETARQDALARADELETVAQFQGDMITEINTIEMGQSVLEGLRESNRARVMREGGSEADAIAAIAEFDANVAETDATSLAINIVDKHIFQPALRAVDTRLTEQPKTAAAILKTIGIAYSFLHRSDTGAIYLERALDLEMQTRGPDDPATIATATFLTRALLDDGAFAPRAREILIPLIETKERVLGEDHESYLDSLNHYGWLLQQEGKFVEAEEAFRVAAENMERVLGAEHQWTMQAMMNAVDAMSSQGKHEEAITEMLRLIDVSTRTHGADDDMTLSFKRNAAHSLMALNRLDEAEAMAREHLAGSISRYGETDRGAADAYTLLANVKVAQGDIDAGIEFVKSARAILEAVYGATAGVVFNNRIWEGNILEDAGRLEEARVIYVDTLPEAEAALDRLSIPVVNLYYYLGRVHYRLEEFEAAAEYMREDIVRTVEGAGPDYHYLAISRLSLGDLESALGNYEAALEQFSEAHRVFHMTAGVVSEQYGRAVMGRVDALMALERHDEAIEAQRAFLHELEAATDGFSSGLLIHRANLGVYLRDAGRLEEARATLIESLDQARANLDPTDWRVGNTEYHLGLTLIELGDLKSAEAALTSAYDCLQQSRGAEDPRTTRTAAALADVYDRLHEAEPDGGSDARANEWRDRSATSSGGD